MAETVAVTKFCAAFKNLNLPPCTSCRYCIEENECLKTILIPDMFAALNSREAFHGWNAKYYYLNFPLIEVLRTSARAGNLP